jgi:drug/metabolite transporter (DMT)-like permease
MAAVFLTVPVIACLYPITTAALAYVLLGERLGRWQALGAALAVAGVAMFVATA